MLPIVEYKQLKKEDRLGIQSGDSVEHKQKGPAVSRNARLSLISLTEGKHQTQPLALNQGEAEQMMFYQLEFADILGCVSDWLEELTRHKHLAKAQCQI